MISDALATLPDDTQVWIYAFDEDLTPEQEAIVRTGLDRFIIEWNSHGHPVIGRYQIHEKRFVIIAGHCSDGISGCSIDSKVKLFKDLHDRFGLNALGGTRVFYRNAEGRIGAEDRATFRQMVLTRKISKSTPVFDLTAQTLSDLKVRPLEQPFGESWAARVFGESTSEPAA